ncbi:hypothetical protein [Sorangium sp. So ce1099]|uniref:hypothetical protein n=1 Tax=Sorangium sp. So ce1099 TaxID=3133331 RepID=UPI003F615391
MLRPICRLSFRADPSSALLYSKKRCAALGPGGRGTRKNIDELTRTTAHAIEELGGRGLGRSSRDVLAAYTAEQTDSHRCHCRATGSC